MEITPCNLQKVLSSFQEGLLLVTFKTEVRLSKYYFNPPTCRIQAGVQYGKLRMLHLHHSSPEASHSIPSLLQNLQNLPCSGCFRTGVCTGPSENLPLLESV